MKAYDRAKIAHTVAAINSNNFYPRDIDYLLTQIRDRIGKYPQFKKLLEICHFIAHPEDRTKGMIKDYIQLHILFTRVGTKINQSHISTSTYPRFFYDFLVLYLIVFPQEILFGARRTEIQAMLKKVGKKDDPVKLEITKKNVAVAISNIMTYQFRYLFFNDTHFVTQLKEALDMLGFNLDASEEVKTRISLSFLFLLNGVEIKGDEGTNEIKMGANRIDENKNYIYLYWTYSDKKHVDFSEFSAVKKGQITGNVNNLYVIPLIATKLDFTNHSSEKLQKYMKENPNDVFFPKNSSLNLNDFTIDCI